ncbi:ParA family protein [Paenibacillus campi]|uniref:ParA family protein n=1 Tax=Paenibacillus campi TaxID=3106031 RepID=UPI002B0015EB|nr:ParA family protein [Paenibacillus sp. SGZ-1009]
MTKVIFVGNYKGGVGKTTSVYSIGHFLAKHHHKKVLMLDLDPQSSLSEICLRGANFKNKNNYLKLDELPPQETLNYVFDLFIRKIKSKLQVPLKFDTSKLVKQIADSELYFIPSSLFYEEDKGLDELSLLMEGNIEYFSILSSLISSLKGDHYDFILIDCPPTSSILTQSAFLLSDYYVVPTIEDGISTNGVLHYIQTVGKTYRKYCGVQNEDHLLYKHFFGEKPRLLGVFCTLTRNQVKYNDIRTIFEDQLSKVDAEENIYIFKSYTNNYIAIAKATAEGEVKEEVNNRRDYEEITKEMLGRIKELELKGAQTDE